MCLTSDRTQSLQLLAASTMLRKELYLIRKPLAKQLEAAR